MTKEKINLNLANIARINELLCSCKAGVVNAGKDLRSYKSKVMKIRMAGNKYNN